MKYWLFGILGWVLAMGIIMFGTNEYFKRVLIQNHGPDLGMALWREWRLWG